MFDLSKVKGKKVCVLGFGRSGRAVAALLARKGFQVLISEAAPINHPEVYHLPKEVEIEGGGHTDKIFEYDFWIKSPGLSPRKPEFLEAKKRKIPVYSELEVAIGCMPKGVRIFGVTGTNGKTTTTTLLGQILQQDAQTHKRQVFVCGNIGNPVSNCADKVRAGDDVVIEVSSYQLEDSTYFHPHIACLLNITPDHLDHHGGMQNYIKAKNKIFKNQTGKDFLIINGADGLCAQVVDEIPSQVLAFSTHPKHLLRTDVFFDGDELVFSQGYQIRPPKLKGVHNVENAMAAALMAMAGGVKDDVVQEVFDVFTPMEHRIEPFAYHKGVVYVNDSKATNLDSTITALRSFDKAPHILLILGGRDKGASYEVLIPYLQTYCKQVLTIGEAMDKIDKELHGAFPTIRCGSLEVAVNAAMDEAQKGDIVLLSPACSSFDQFKDYEQRGKIFKQLVESRIYDERIK